MTLRSKLFRGDTQLEACLIRDGAHVLQGARGPHVQKIQRALVLLDGALISSNEVFASLYGRSTADAVLAYKRKRHIINRSYQSTEDDIVGKMTIAALDEEIAKSEARPPLRGCTTDLGAGSGGAVAGIRSGITAGETTQLEFAPGRLNVGFQFAIGPKDKPAGDDIRVPLLAGRASELLKPFGLTLSMRGLPSFPFGFTVGERDDVDVRSIRTAAENASRNTPSALRVIFCHLRNTTSTATSQGRATGIEAFPNFILMNLDLVHPDNGTLLHEMIHCSADRFMNDIHDDDENSIYSRGRSRTVLKDEHAKSLNASFFRSGPLG